MKRLIRELRRREVFRTAGLYVGLCWIVIEAASVLLPTFDAPEWALKAIIIAAVVGFPVMLVLAWVYDITDSGIEVQADPADTIVPPLGSRRMDFIVIGVLTVALVLSLYMNISGGPKEQPTLDPVSVLIADFDNQTGDEMFDGAVEQTLNIGIEGASFITAFNRNAAKSHVERIRPGAALDEEGARLVAVREGIKLVLTGVISESNGRYEFTVHAVEPESGEVVAAADQEASDKLQVLAAVSDLAEQIRKELGDTETEIDAERATETFTAGSLQAAQFYTRAQDLAYQGNYDGSIEYYARAVEADPAFGRAYSGWALAAFNLGRNEEAEEQWQNALKYMETMTARERYRTLGLYYMGVTNNYPKAIESYESLVNEFPADGAGHNNLAVAYFTTLNFERALQEAQAVLDIYPANVFYKQNLALFAMYAGQFDLAEAAAKEVIAADASRYYAWLPVAVAALARDDFAAAEQSYQSMASTGERGASMANLGLADMALFRGEFSAAATLLQQGIATDADGGNQRTIATKQLALAAALDGNGDGDAAMIALTAAAGSSTYRQVPAALLHLESARHQPALDIAAALEQDLRAQYRAYGKMITGMVASRNGDHVAALDTLREASGLFDYWLIRFQLGRAYLAAGQFAEAMDELAICERRRGEAAAIFLDDLPSWRYLATLPYWQGIAMAGVGMQEAARQKLQAFIGSRTAEDALLADARRRLAE